MCIYIYMYLFIYISTDDVAETRATPELQVISRPLFYSAAAFKYNGAWCPLLHASRCFIST